MSWLIHVEQLKDIYVVQLNEMSTKEGFPKRSEQLGSRLPMSPGGADEYDVPDGGSCYAETLKDPTSPTVSYHPDNQLGLEDTPDLCFNLVHLFYNSFYPNKSSQSWFSYQGPKCGDTRSDCICWPPGFPEICCFLAATWTHTPKVPVYPKVENVDFENVCQNNKWYLCAPLH